MVKCPRCGYENATSSMYCDNCAYPLQNRKSYPTNNSKNRKSWSVGIAKKIVIVLGIIIIAFLLFSFVFNNSQPSKDDTLNVIYDNGTQHQSSTYPFKAVIKSDGNWFARMGDPNYLVEKTGSGENTFLLDCAAWDDVEITAEKYSGENLTIQLLRNGKVVAENSTTNGYNSVSIKYDTT